MAFRLHPVSQLVETGGGKTFGHLLNKFCRHSLA